MTELDDYIQNNATIRLRTNRPARDMCLRLVVKHWPFGCREDEAHIVLMERICKELKSKYSGLLLMYWLYVVVAEAVQVSTDWVAENDRHRDLMAKYHAQAS